MAKANADAEIKFKPADSVVGVLRRITGKRSAKAFFMRKSTANLMERLTNEEQDAMVEILKAYKAIIGKQGHRLMCWGDTGGKVEDCAAFAVGVTGKVIEWQKKVGNNTANITMAICSENHSISSSSEIMKRRWNTIFSLFRTGLQGWMEL